MIVEIITRRASGQILHVDDDKQFGKNSDRKHSVFHSKDIGQYFISLLSMFLTCICEYIYILNKVITIPTQC